MFKKYLLPVLLAICIVAAAITTEYTVAYYTDASGNITNTFSVPDSDGGKKGLSSVARCADFLDCVEKGRGGQRLELEKHISGYSDHGEVACFRDLKPCPEILKVKTHY